MTLKQPPKRGTLLALAGLVALIAFSEHLAFNRIFQVDELEGVFTARLLATHHLQDYSAAAGLMHMGPMRWIAGSTDRSALMLRMERLLFFPLFWLNLCLIVRCAGFRLRSQDGLIALLLVATLAPLWDYGFEIRHETPLLTAMLLAWSAARPLAADAKRRLFVVGFLCVIAQFVAHKAFAYMLPIALFALVAAKLDEKRAVWRAAAALVTGAACGLAIALLIHWSSGTWSEYSSDVKGLAGAAMTTVRFSALPTLARLLWQSPLLLIAVVGAVGYALTRFRQPVTSRDSLLPELAFLAGALVAIFANPTPFPYNLVLVVPQAAILCLRLRPLVSRYSTPAWRVLLAILFIVHVVFWLNSTRRHLVMSNARQLALATVAEELTDPKLHRVLDGAALVPTRFPPGRYWLIHTFTIQQFRSGAYPSIRSQLAEGRTPVIIPNYRINALPPEDHQFISEHYIGVSGDFLVAGGEVEAARGYQFECLVPGRYYDTRQRRVVTLTRGQHTFDGGGYLVWIGPKLQEPPSLEQGDSRRVLVNWY